MYNTLVKNQYLQSLTGTVTKDNDAIRIFKLLEKFEQEVETDIYDIPNDILMKEIIKRSRITSYIVFQARYYTIKDYKTWALLNNYISNDAKYYVDEKINLKQLFLEHNTVSIYKNPSDLSRVLRAKLVKRSADNAQITIDEICTAYVMLIYQGFDPREALDIRVNDVNITNKNCAIVTQEKAIIVYPEFQDIIKKVAQTRWYLYKHANMEDVLPLNEFLIDNGRNADAKHRRQNLMVVLNSRDLHLKLKDIYYMGKLYDYYSNHQTPENRGKILEYCFGGDRLTKSVREQFYRFIELWNA